MPRLPSRTAREGTASRLLPNIEQWMTAMAPALRAGYTKIGLWNDGNDMRLNVTVVLPDRETTEKFARQQHQNTVFDLARGQSIVTGIGTPRPFNPARGSEQLNMPAPEQVRGWQTNDPKDGLR